MAILMIDILDSSLTIYNGKAHCQNNTVNGGNDLKWLTCYLFGIPEKMYYDFYGKNV